MTVSEGLDRSDFRIGMEFMMGGALWRCTDVGTRTVAAIKLDRQDQSWYEGPPYAVAEMVIDEDDFEGCSRVIPEVI